MLGLAAGCAMSWLLAQRIRDLLFDPSPADAVAYGIAGGVVIVATAAASIAPAWRAMRADPMRALRSD